MGEGKPVRLPHTVAELPLHYADHTAYQGICGYRRKLDLGQDLAGKHIFLQFDGAAHIATVYLNGRELTTHRCGYTGFRVEITDTAVLGGENLLWMGWFSQMYRLARRSMSSACFQLMSAL